MNTTNIENKNFNNEKIELYLFLLVVKISLLIGIKVAKACVAAYKMHNNKIINKHNKSSITKLKAKAEQKTSEETV